MASCCMKDIAGWWVGERQNWPNMYYEQCGVQAIVPSEVHPSKLQGVWQAKILNGQ
jgi:hypothetical protein